MWYITLICNDCDEKSEVYCDGDNAMMCPECRSIDNFREVEREDDCKFCMGTNLSQYSNNKPCVHCK